MCCGVEFEQVPYCLVPDLQRLAADAVEDRQETRLEGVLEHGDQCTGSKQ